VGAASALTQHRAVTTVTAREVVPIRAPLRRRRESIAPRIDVLVKSLQMEESSTALRQL